MENNLTQFIGVASNLTAATACGASGALVQDRWRLQWQVLAMVFLALSVEVALGYRFQIHDFFSEMLRQRGEYPRRQGIEAVALATAVMLATVMALMLHSHVVATLRVTHWAAGAATLAVSLILVESISLGEVDRVMWHQFADVMLIGWAWSAFAVGSAVAALRGITQQDVLQRRARSAVCKF